MTQDLAALVAQATPGPWKWWTSNSWKRLSSEKQEGGVICPFVSRDDHPDLTVSEADARLIAMAPDLARTVLDQQAEIARLTARAEKAEAALSESQAMLAAAFEVAANTAADRCAACGVREISGLVGEHIRRLTPADAQAALDARINAAKEEGLRLAAKICTRGDDRAAILAKIKEAE